MVRDLIVGIIELVFCHLAALVLLVIAMYGAGAIWGGYSALLPLILAGYSWSFLQLLYVVPLMMYHRRQKRPYRERGVLIGAIITALLHGGICYLPVFLSR
jgi:hypothetical protein